MSIDRLFTDAISIQTGTEGFGGDVSYSTDGSNVGYIRMLSDSERTEDAKNKLFSTHRFSMTTTTAVSYGKYLLHNSIRYRVVTINESGLDNQDVYIVDAERIQ